jgi:hypothetical protein
MIMESLAIRLLFAALLVVVSPHAAIAHGGVVQEDDLCLIKVSYLSAHFKIYQPLVSGHQQFCEDLPVASESVFVMEYEHDSLAAMPIDFRIIRDVTGKGRFARMEDIDQIEDIESVTVFYQPAIVEPDVFTVIHEFDDEGEFIGIVSASLPGTDREYAAVFPFEVGFTGIGYWPFFIGVLLLLQFQYLFMSGRLKRWFRSRSSTALLVLFACALSAAQGARADQPAVQVTYSTPGGAIEINRIHSWILHVEFANGEPVTDADISVSGGMPQHNHGLPTRPRVTREIGDGDYRLDGMRFHMGGYWEIVVTIATADGQHVVTVPLQL